MTRTRTIPLLAAALLSMSIAAALPVAGADGSAVSGDVRIGVPGGVTLDAFAHPANGEVYVFVRFAEPRTGDVVVTFRDAEGADLAVRTVTLERGSAMLLWDRATDDGATAAAGECRACATIDGREMAVAFTLP
jgi:uncharacterized protein (DUF58 family)